MSRDKRHISEDEKRKSFLMMVLIGILGAILVVIVIIMIPKGKKKTNYQDLSSKVSDNKNLISNNTSTEEKVKRDESKVDIIVDEETVSPEGAIIKIVDKNENKYQWTALYSLEEKVDGKWKEMILKNPENMTLPDVPVENNSGDFSQSLVWSNKYGTLDSGEYRIVKESIDGTKFYGEFKID